MEATANEKIEAVGLSWTISKYATTMMRAPFVGRSTFGFEEHSGRCVMTWIDSMAPVLCTIRGTKTGDTVSMLGTFYSCMTTSGRKRRATDEMISKDERIFEMFVTMPDGLEKKMMANHCKRT